MSLKDHHMGSAVSIEADLWEESLVQVDERGYPLHLWRTQDLLPKAIECECRRCFEELRIGGIYLGIRKS